MMKVDDLDMLSMYRETFKAGSNLIFLSYGNDQHHKDAIEIILKHIIGDDRHRYKEYCSHIDSDITIGSSYREFNEKYNERRLFIVQGMENLHGDERSRLNFLYRAKDPSAKSNVVVFLAWNSDSKSLESSLDDLSNGNQVHLSERKILKSFGIYFHSEENYLNGPALVGRIDDVIFPNPDYAPSSSEPLDLCSRKGNVTSSLQEFTDDPFASIKKFLSYPKLLVSGLLSVSVYAMISYLRKGTATKGTQTDFLDNEDETKSDSYPNKAPTSLAGPSITYPQEMGQGESIENKRSVIKPTRKETPSRRGKTQSNRKKESNRRGNEMNTPSNQLNDRNMEYVTPSFNMFDTPARRRRAATPQPSHKMTRRSMAASIRNEEDILQSEL